jgi:hypothetical protein
VQCCCDSGEPPPATPEQIPAPAEDLIIGIAAAADHLCYDKRDSFRRARTRHPIPGETRTTDGRPAWTPTALQTWRADTATAREPGKHGPTKARD